MWDLLTAVLVFHSDEVALILIRHGESLWNEKNLFTGCVDVPLTKKGVEEAIEAGKRISNIPVDMIYTSSLIRAQMTAMLAMTQHRRRKVTLGNFFWVFKLQRQQFLYMGVKSWKLMTFQLVILSI